MKLCNDDDNVGGGGDVKVFQVCGKPSLGGARHRRSRRRSIYDWNLGVLDVRHHIRPTAPGDVGQFEALVHDIHERLLTTRNFWHNLPDAVCSQLAAAPFELTNCWNGLGVSRSVRSSASQSVR